MDCLINLFVLAMIGSFIYFFFRLIFHPFQLFLWLLLAAHWLVFILLYALVNAEPLFHFCISPFSLLKVLPCIAYTLKFGHYHSLLMKGGGGGLVLNFIKYSLRYSRDAVSYQCKGNPLQFLQCSSKPLWYYPCPACQTLSKIEFFFSVICIKQ